MTAHEPLRPLTKHAISPPSNMIIPFSNSISPMETSLPVCPFRQGRFPFCGRFAWGRHLSDLPRTTGALPMPPLCKGRRQTSPIFDGGVVNTKSVQGRIYQPLSQSDGCQLPLHEGVKGHNTSEKSTHAPVRTAARSAAGSSRRTGSY